MADAAPSPLKDGRASLRDTAKWMMTGVFGVIALLVGSGTIPLFATLAPWSTPFYIAAGTLGTAALLCWLPFWLAVRVLRSDILQLEDFAYPRTREFRKVSAMVDRRIGSTLAKQGTIEAFFTNYAALKASARTNTDQAAADAAVASLKTKFEICRETCISQLVSNRFSQLAISIGVCGTIIIVLFAISVYTMNAGKQTVVTPGKLGTEKISASLDDTLQHLKVDPACFGKSAQLITFGPADGGALTKVLVPKPDAATTCQPKVVTYLAAQPVRVE